MVVLGRCSFRIGAAELKRYQLPMLEPARSSHAGEEFRDILGRAQGGRSLKRGRR